MRGGGVFAHCEVSSDGALHKGKNGGAGSIDEMRRVKQLMEAGVSFGGRSFEVLAGFEGLLASMD